MENGKLEPKLVTGDTFVCSWCVRLAGVSEEEATFPADELGCYCAETGEPVCVYCAEDGEPVDEGDEDEEVD